MAEPLTVLRWDTPPPAQHPQTPRTGSIFDDVAAELRDMPRTWGVIFEARSNRASGMASNINNGVYPCFRPHGSFQAVARMRDGVRTVYARYVGEAST